MYRRNPTALVYEDEDGWWIETTTGQDGTFVEPSIGKSLARLNSTRTFRADDFSEKEFHLLVEHGALIDASSSDLDRSGYHLATRDHPFLDMSAGLDARIADAQIMAGYVQSDEYPPIYLDLDVRETIQLENAADLATDELRNSPICQLSLILSGTFGVRKHQAPYFDPVTDYHQVELVLKSIPSGGGRHPTELFLEVLRSPLFDEGFYHYQPRTNVLERIEYSGFHAPELTIPSNPDADWQIKIYMASAVRRAMFRYRDPRSFRAILVDAGHADGQIAALAAYCNWNYRSCVTPKLDFTRAPTGVPNQFDLPLLISGYLEGWL